MIGYPIKWSACLTVNEIMLIILFRVKLGLFLAHNTFSCQISFYF